MRFERNKDPMDAMGIGKDAAIKKIFIDCIKTHILQTSIAEENWEVAIKWALWTKGIEVEQVITLATFPEDYKYKFLYKDCNGEEAHIRKEIILTAREMST